MNDKELWELISIISEGQDSEQRRKVEQYITDLQREIERLNKELEQEKKDFKEANDKCFELTLENKRLNNIINELEKWIKEDTEKSMMTMETGRAFNMFDILDKLQELKGSD